MHNKSMAKQSCPLQKYWESDASSFIFAVHWKHNVLSSKAVVPNHRAADRYRYVGYLVPGCRERINKLFHFHYTDNHTL